MVAIFGLQDPLREEIIPSVANCRRAGVTVRMVTGDNLDTARAIAVEAGIISEEDAYNRPTKYGCIEGQDFRKLVKLSQVRDDDGKIISEKLEDR